MQFSFSHNFSQLGHYISMIHDGNIGFKANYAKKITLGNRQQISKKRGFDAESVVALQQAHTNNIFIAHFEDGGAGSLDWESGIADADGLITNTKGITLLVQSADCPLVLLFDPLTNVLGVVHSGWRGTVQGIIPEAVRQMQNTFNVLIENVYVGITPCAGSCCYDIGMDVTDKFLALFPENVVIRKNDKKFLDLKTAINYQLFEAGVSSNHIETNSICTICDLNFYSYRREKDHSGRFGLFAWLI